VIYESALLGFLGGVAGVALGTLGLKVLQATTSIHGLLEPDLSPQFLLSSVAIAVAVGVISGLYPAWRGSRLTPSSALNS
jgi:putative ABC transport system permease protein